jgi:hypothetical protein
MLAGESAGNLVCGLPERSLLPALQSAAYHHERWDGRGYPHGARGLEIPLIARITAVCDAYDAMRANGPTRRREPRDCLPGNTNVRRNAVRPAAVGGLPIGSCGFCQMRTELKL